MKKALKRGFSLIETMIAISVLVLVITGPLTLAAQSLKAASAAKNNLIAANLAQEGIELIRLYRTNNILQGRGWMEGLLPPGPAECQSPANGCYIDALNFDGSTQNFEIKNCSGGFYPNGCPLLKMNARNFYNYTSGNTTIFQRTIRLKKIDDDIVRINVTINWKGNTGGKSLSVEEIILNWLRL